MFDLKNPKSIDFSNLKEVQKNTYEFMKEGQEVWQKSIDKIVDFIEQKPKRVTLDDLLLCHLAQYYPEDFFKNLFEIKWSKRRGKLIKIFGIIIYEKGVD